MFGTVAGKVNDVKWPQFSLGFKIALTVILIGSIATWTYWLTGGLGGDFDLSRHNVPLDQIVSGGPPKDWIPALLSPQFVTASEASFLKPEDRVLALSRGKEAKAYPIKILNWHEVVNDTLAGKPLLVTYCPLCGTGIGFDPVVNGNTYTFGVSGLLYQSDLLMYDHQTESLWSQIDMEAVTGPMMGTKLTHVFLDHTTWDEWRARHPTTLVLSTKTGSFFRNYDREPYDDYAQNSDLMFDVQRVDLSYPIKEWVLGIEVDDTFKAYPFSELEKASQPLADQVNGQTVHIHFNPRANSASITDADGKPLPSMMAYWFAWYTFHPDTQVFKARQ